MASSLKHSALFVCLGNICRSPMGEAVLKHKLNKKKIASEWLVDSAGTANYHVGEPPDDRCIGVLARRGISTDHVCRQLSKDDFKTFEYILVFDRENLSNVMRKKPKESKTTVKLLGEYSKQTNDEIIEDPYYIGTSAFEKNYEQVDRCLDEFLKSVGC